MGNCGLMKARTQRRSPGLSRSNPVAGIARGQSKQSISAALCQVNYRVNVKSKLGARLAGANDATPRMSFFLTPENQIYLAKRATGMSQIGVRPASQSAWIWRGKFGVEATAKCMQMLPDSMRSAER